MGCRVRFSIAMWRLVCAVLSLLSIRLVIADPPSTDPFPRTFNASSQGTKSLLLALLGRRENAAEITWCPDGYWECSNYPDKCALVGDFCCNEEYSCPDSDVCIKDGCCPTYSQTCGGTRCCTYGDVCCYDSSGGCCPSGSVCITDSNYCSYSGGGSGGSGGDTGGGNGGGATTTYTPPPHTSTTSTPPPPTTTTSTTPIFQTSTTSTPPVQTGTISISITFDGPTTTPETNSTVSSSNTHPSTSTVLSVSTVSAAATSTSSALSVGAAAPSFVLSLGNQLAILATILGPILRVVANVW